MGVKIKSSCCTITMAAANIQQPWVCGWPNSTKSTVGYSINPVPALQVIFTSPLHYGSFSFKNDRPLQFTWTNQLGARVGAYITSGPDNEATACVTFHPIIAIIDNNGLWHERCNRNVQLQVCR